MGERKMERRRFLQFVTSSALLGTSGYLIWRHFEPAPLGESEWAMLSRFLDELIPSDRSPGALEVGVLDELKELARKDGDYRRLLRYGVEWLEDQAQALGRSLFTTVDERTAHQILSTAEAAAPERIERIFFLRISQDAFEAYYSKPESWEMLGYPGPPQPRGYIHPERPFVAS